MKFTSNASRGDKETRPAVPIESTRRGSLKKITCKVARDCELPGQFWTVQWKTPVKEIPQLYSRSTIHPTLLRYIMGIYTVGNISYTHRVLFVFVCKQGSL